MAHRNNATEHHFTEGGSIQTLCQSQVRTRYTTGGKATVTVLENLHEKVFQNFFELGCVSLKTWAPEKIRADYSMQ